jgi:hypothetical protein
VYPQYNNNKKGNNSNDIKKRIKHLEINLTHKLKRIENKYLNKYLYVYSSIVYNMGKLVTAQTSISRWINKVYPHNGKLFSH